ncbi:MAG: ATP-binding cassette domain-containing protein [Lacisediminihabitans sp.]
MPMTELGSNGGTYAMELCNVTKQYPGVEAPSVDGISLRIRPGEMLVLIGSSGCGKSTTLRMINRLVEMTSGDILVEGRNIQTLDPVELRRGIGYVIQNVGLMPHLTIAQNVGFVAKLMKWPSQKINSRVEELLNTVGLEPGRFRDRYPRQLSGGQQQRVGVARSLMLDPPVILMDEPFGAVDALLRRQLQQEMLQLQERLHKTIVLVTHDIAEAFILGDRIAVMSNGRLLQCGSPSELISEPADQVVTDLLADSVRLRRLDLLTLGDAVSGGSHAEDPAQPSVSLDEKTTLRQALVAIAQRTGDRGVTVTAQDKIRGFVSQRKLLEFVALDEAEVNNQADKIA